MVDYPCSKFGDFTFSRFGLSCEQTHTHTESHTDADDRYTHATTVGVINNNKKST